MEKKFELIWDNGMPKRVVTLSEINEMGEDFMLVAYHREYTGLRDKNCQEIYEGDIIRHTNKEADHTPYAVPCICPEHYEDLLGIGDSEWLEGDYQFSNIEVLGNIYENEELLKN